MSDLNTNRDPYAMEQVPFTEVLWNLLRGIKRATPVEQIPLPEGRLPELATWATQGNPADTSEQIMNRTDQATNPEGLVGRMLTPQERAMLMTLIQQLLK